MMRKDKTRKLQCGCKTLITSHNDPNSSSEWPSWIEAVSVQDLQRDLGHCAEDWFDNLSAEPSLSKTQNTSGDGQAGWSPCPAGGFMDTDASPITPFQVNRPVQLESPVLWPTLLSDSSASESALLGRDSSEDEDNHDNSTVSSIAFCLDRSDLDERDSKRRLFSTDTSNLSWTSSMATPPSTDLKKLSVAEEKQREKVTARALFTPNTSIEESEFSETDGDKTIEQLEGSLSLFTADMSSTASPSVTLLCSSGTCTWHKTTEGKAAAELLPCDPNQPPVVEIHCTDKKTPSEKSLCRDSDLTCHTKGSVASGRQVLIHESPCGCQEESVCHVSETGQQKLRENGCSVHSVMNRNDSLSRPHEHPESELEKAVRTSATTGSESKRKFSCPRSPEHGDDNARSVVNFSQSSSGDGRVRSKHQPADTDKRGSPLSKDVADCSVEFELLSTEQEQHDFNTSTPKPQSRISGRSFDLMSPLSTTVEGRMSVRKMNPKNLISLFGTDETTSVDKVLADFFSSPETAEKQKRCAPTKRSVPSSPLDDCNEEEWKRKPHVRLDSRCELPSLNSKIDVSSPDPVTKSGEASKNCLDTSDKICVAEDDNSILGKRPHSDADQTLQKQPRLGNTSVNLCKAYSSPAGTATPPSILRSAGKRQTPLSEKRVRFFEDCMNSSSQSSSKVQRVLTTAKGMGDKELENELSVCIKDCDFISSDKLSEKKENIKEFSNLPCRKSSKTSETATGSADERPFSSDTSVSLRSQARPEDTTRMEELASNVGRITTKLPPAGSISPDLVISMSGSVSASSAQLQKEKNNTFTVAENSDSNPVQASKTVPTLTPNRSTTQRPRLRLGLKRPSCFMYPTSSQIMETCPRNVYTFNAGDGSTSRVPQDAVKQTFAGQAGEESTAVVSASDADPTVNNTVGPGCASHSEISSVSIIPMDNEIDKEEYRELGSTLNDPVNKAVIENSVSAAVEDDYNEIDEEPDWSDLEDFSTEATAVNSDTVCDRQRMEAMKDNPNYIEERCSGTKNSVTKEKNSNRTISNSVKTSKEELLSPERLSTQYQRINCEVQEYTAEDASGIKRRTVPLSPGLALSTPSSSALPLSGSCQQRSTLSQAVPEGHRYSLPVDVLGPESLSVVQQHREDSENGQETQAQIQQDNKQQDTLDELLCGVDFSQELLSQSRTCPENGPVEEAERVVKEISQDPLQLAHANQMMTVLKGDAVKIDQEDLKTVTEVAMSANTHPEAGELSADTSTAKLSPGHLSVQSEMQLKSKNSSSPPGLDIATNIKQNLEQKSKSAAELDFQRDLVQGVCDKQLCAASGKFTGFTSAAGKSVQLTEKAFAKAKALFQDDSFNLDRTSLNACMEDSSIDYVSDEGLLCSSEVSGKRVLSEDSVWTRKTSEQGLFSSQFNSASGAVNMTDATAVSGFKTASGKDFHLSSKAQQRAEELWKAVEHDVYSHTKSTSDTDDDVKKGCCVGPSADTMMSKEKDSPCETTVPSVTCAESVAVDSSLQNPVSVMTNGFKTASGRAVPLSLKSQEKAVKLWQHVKNELASSSDNIQSDKEHLSGAEMQDFACEKPGDGVLKDILNLTVEETGKSHFQQSKSLRSPLPLRQPPVPQGFRPFKAPTVIRQVSEEERYTTKIPEPPPPCQTNTILHHFSKVKDTHEQSSGSIQTLSDDFPDDDEDMWDIENMEHIVCSKNTESGGQKDSELLQKNNHENQNSLANSCGNITGSVKFENMQISDRAIYPKSEQSQQTVAELHSDVLPLESLKNHSESRTLNTEQQMNEADEMSDAVLADLSHDMYEATQADTALQKSYHCESQTKLDLSSHNDAGTDAGYLQQIPDAKLIPALRDSPVPLNIGNVSFESLRCDENVSFEERDASCTHPNTNNPSALGYEIKTNEDIQQGSFRRMTLLDQNDVREIDFDSSIPDPTVSVTVNEYCKTENDDENIDSSYLEKNTLDMSCMERELDSSHVEVSGGDVWADSMNSSHGSGHATIFESLDAVNEEKYAKAMFEMEGSVKNSQCDLEDQDEIMPLVDEYDVNSSCPPDDIKPSSHLMERRSGLENISDGKTSPHSAERQKSLDQRHSNDLIICVSGDSSTKDKNGLGDVAANESQEGHPEDSSSIYTRASITDNIMYSLSRGKDNGDISESDLVANAVDMSCHKVYKEQIHASGDKHVQMPFSTNTSPSRRLCNNDGDAGLAKNNVTDSVVNHFSEMEETEMGIETATTSAPQNDSRENDQLWTDSEVLSQVCISQANQTMTVMEQKGAGDAQFLNRSKTNSSEINSPREIVRSVITTGNHSVPQVAEFHSVSDKPTVIAEKYLESVEDVLNLGEENIKKGSELNFPSLTRDVFCGFKTAGGQEMSVLNSSLIHARNMFGGEQDQSACCDNRVTDGTSCPPHALHDQNLGFQTAAGAGVTVSERSLGHARSLFQSCDGQSDIENKTALPTSQTRALPGFQTASGPSVSVSKRALSHARKMLSSEENLSCVDEGDGAVAGEHTVPSHQAFQNGKEGGTPVPARRLHHSETDLAKKSSVIPCDSSASRDPSCETMVDTNKVGFLTASGGKVNVSAKALQHAQKILDLPDSEVCKGQMVDKNKFNEISTSADCQFQGFQTCSGRSVSISENALKNARKMLGSTDSLCSFNQVDIADDQEIDPTILRTTGFQTAGGGKVSVSRKALQHAQSALRDNENVDTRHCFTPKMSEQRSCGFQTAGGSSVTISHKSLQHARKLFEDDKDVHPLPSQPSVDTESAASCSTVSSLHGQTLMTTPDAVHHPEISGFAVPTFEDADGPSATSAGHDLHHTDSRLHPEKQGSSRVQERRNRQPVVSDETSALEGDSEQQEPGHDDGHRGVQRQRRVMVKRTALYADCEAILHDRSAKRVKLQAATALEMDAPLPVPLPEISVQSNAPRSSSAKKSTSTFQPPYKKPKFSPPTTKASAEDLGHCTSQKPKFKPPTLNSSVSTSSKVNSDCPLQNDFPSKESKSAETEHFSDVVVHPHVSRKPEMVERLDQSMFSKNKTCMASKKSVLRGNMSETQVELDQLSSADRSQSEQSKHSMDLSVCAKEDLFAAQEAKMCQEKIIRQKKRQKVRPVQGRWLTYKLTQKQITFEDWLMSAGCHRQKEMMDVSANTAACHVTSRSAEEFRFYLPSFYTSRASGPLVGDGALLVPDRHGYAGKEEFYHAFLTIDGVDPGLVSEAWLYNHYRWIVWKLAAYEVSLPHCFTSRALTPDTVMFQLKYRYDREEDTCQRSALKRIVERDDTPCKRLVLCVSDLNVQMDDNSQVTMLEVTDGWYCLPCKPDSALQDLIDRKKVEVGQKMVTTGAELAGSQEPCSPLELSAGLHLKLHGNSTRPAPPRAKLGYQRDPTPLCVPLDSLHPQGGVVGCVDVVVVRKYPLMWLEKPAGGGGVLQTEEMEEKARRRHEEQRQQLMEKLCSQLQAQMEKEEEGNKCGHQKRSLKTQEVQALTSGAEISDAMDTVSHPEDFQGMLSSTQLQQLLDYRQRQQEERQRQLNERLQQALGQSAQGDRTVVPLQKFRIAGCCRRDIDSKTGVMLTVWRPGPEWQNVQEGHRYRLYSLTAAPARCRTSGQHVELTSGRQTRIQSADISENLLDMVYEPREISVVADLQHKTVPYNEFDFVGMVVTIRTGLRGSDAVYAVDIDGTLLLIWFWGGLRTFGLEDTLTEGAPFCASNLRLKSCSQDKVECSAVLELSHFSTTGRTTAQRQHLQQWRDKASRSQLLQQGREKVSQIRSSARPSSAPATEMLEDLPPSFLDKLLGPFTQSANTDTSTSSTPASNKSLNTSSTAASNDSLNISTTAASNDSLNTSTTSNNNSLLQNSSVFNTSFDASTSTPSPCDQAASRKRQAQREKLARLQAYGRAPALSPLTQVVSPAASKAFKAPTPHKQ